MFIGCRGTVRVEPTVRGAGSREASEPVYLTPVCASAGPKFGLSVGICGSDSSPECSPVTSSARSTLIPLRLAQLTLSSTCAAMSACETHCVAPVVGSVAHRHGCAVKSCTQPRYWWLNVWLTQRNWDRSATSLALS